MHFRADKRKTKTQTPRHLAVILSRFSLLHLVSVLLVCVIHLFLLSLLLPCMRSYLPAPRHAASHPITLSRRLRYLSWWGGNLSRRGGETCHDRGGRTKHGGGVFYPDSFGNYLSKIGLGDLSVEKSMAF